MKRQSVWVALALTGLLFLPSRVLGQGLVAPSAGPINSGMAGASTAAPIEFGSTYWNPANLSGLDRQEFLLGSALTIPSIHLQNSLKAGSIGGLPLTNRSGLSRSNSGVVSGVATGTAFRLSDDSPLTFGLGVFGFVGGGVNLAGSFQNPILTPRRAPNFFGVGPIYSNMSILEIAPMASIRVNDWLSVGGGPLITSGSVSLSPAFFAPGPKDVTGLPTFPSGTNSRPFWGGGFQLGLLAELNENWNAGFSYKSPIWQEPWAYNASNPDLSPRSISVQASLPAIYSWGLAFKGIPRTLLALDMRLFDYKSAQLFGDSVASGGLGWQNVFAVALGAQHHLTDRIDLLGGYLYNTNPISATNTLFNVQAPGIIQNNLSLGASLHLTDSILFSASWVHGFRNSVSGSILQLPGSETKLDAQTDTLWAGLTIRFGESRTGK
jgi:long-chain fatty acid transport protein